MFEAKRGFLFFFFITLLCWNENTFWPHTVHAIISYIHVHGETIAKSTKILSNQAWNRRYTFLYSWCQIYVRNVRFTKRLVFVSCKMTSLAYTTMSPQGQRWPLHMLCMYIATFPSPKGFLGLREERTHDTKFNIPVTNVIYSCI